MTKEEIESLINGEASTKPPEVWAALAKNPVSSLFLTSGQMKVAQSNVLKSLCSTLEGTIEREETASNELRSIKDQLNHATSFIAGQINTIKQQHPNVVKNFDI